MLEVGFRATLCLSITNVHLLVKDLHLEKTQGGVSADGQKTWSVCVVRL